MTLQDFFRRNEVQIGEEKDYTAIPPMYYSSLDNAFLAFFNTFRDNKRGYHILKDILHLKRESISRNLTDSNDHIIISILGFHRFIELFFKDLLSRINPYLSVKFIEGEDNLFRYLDNQNSADELKSIEYAEASRRLHYAFKYYDKQSDIYTQLLCRYEFLTENDVKEGLSELSQWRNRIMHNGNNLPNFFAFDYLISQIVIPLVNKIFASEKDLLSGYQPHYFKTKTGINVVEEISKIQMSITDFSDRSKVTDLSMKLFKLGHLKELGRAAYSQDFLIRRHESHYEPHYKNPVGRYERLAKMERKHRLFHALYKCCCCGIESLVVYKASKTNIVTNAFEEEKWFICFNCGYSMDDNIGDPSRFGFSESPYFS